MAQINYDVFLFSNEEDDSQLALQKLLNKKLVPETNVSMHDTVRHYYKQSHFNIMLTSHNLINGLKGKSQSTFSMYFESYLPCKSDEIVELCISCRGQLRCN